MKATKTIPRTYETVHHEPEYQVIPALIDDKGDIIKPRVIKQIKDAYDEQRENTVIPPGWDLLITAGDFLIVNRDMTEDEYQAYETEQAQLALEAAQAPLRRRQYEILLKLEELDIKRLKHYDGEIGGIEWKSIKTNIFALRNEYDSLSAQLGELTAEEYQERVKAREQALLSNKLIGV